MVELTRDPISLDRTLTLVASPAAGAVCLFLGVVRDNNEGHGVSKIQYEAYEDMAREQLEAVEREIRERWPVTGVALVHRLGLLTVGEASVVVAVSSGHRGESFEACRHGIDRLKQLVPIWKKEFTPDGISWVGLQ
jgi:molybdopterin synthase catalytic subunit